MALTGELEGKVAIVTGAGLPGNIGSETAAVLAREGAKVVLADVDHETVRRTTDALAAKGHDVACFAADISSEQAVKDLIAFTIDTFGRLDAIDNNAARTSADQDLLVGDMDVDWWDETFAVNTRGTMLMCKHAIPAMIRNGGGSIINISSGTVVGGNFFSTAYASSKGAVETLTRYIATQYGSQGIRCNAVSPGPVLTSSLKKGLPDDLREIFRRHTLIGKYAAPAEIGEVVSFLASDRSSFVTGQVIQVDGGIASHLSTSVEIAELMAGGTVPQ
ncbi:SDR family NAD(P)-dependent oxidoreductase [Novosphingobium cyanobacteriorum]|uniref:SDR family oxidoreductase n=1 Tax=Novosphingobium cyanobacteriorum TaxID=3024215 RepID=A0ABT6CNA4_9SPHN|nr:SDR family oxidoreductase [Novosphingobium cyanobacteriorum]MDF8335396.1 SDR family oxidoreductase [Novosphingobium cyanobacteriorum]